MPYPKDHNEENQEDLISNFLNTFANNYQSDSTEGEVNPEEDWIDLEDVQLLTIDDYPAAMIPEGTEAKIARFQGITKSIEKRVQETIKNAPKPEENLGSFNYKINYKNSLNTGQYLAVITIKGPVLVIAGAGSGKTRTIVYRASYLLENKVEPEKILLLTFTRKASQEMINRTSALLRDKSAERITRGTYHSFSNMILRRYAKMLGISSTFTIIDSVDSQDIIDLIRQEMKFTKKSKAFPRKKRISDIISKSRNCNTTTLNIILEQYSALLEFSDDIEVIAKLYKQYKKGNNLLDYDDLMEFFRDSLRDNEAFRLTIQKMYDYVMVDEFQDTNIVQKEIVDYIAGGHQNIMIVGDDSQSIYAFRGANFENILTFPETYPKCKVIKLEQNYRSNQDLLDFTNSVANNAMLGYEKKLFSQNRNAWKPLVCKFYDQQEEAEFIVSKIMDLRERDIPLNQIAVLYRSSFHGNYIQAELLKRSIPYVIVGGIRFTERRHIKDLMAYLRLIINPYDAVSWNRVLKLIPGVGRVTAGKIVNVLQENKGEIDFQTFQKAKYHGALEKLQNVLNKVLPNTMSISTKMELLINYYEPLLASQEADFEVRLQDLDVLCNLAARYEDLEKFLSDFALDPPSNKFQDRNSPLIDESEDKPITLSTIHSAKGLEWYCVFVPHLLDGVFPSTRSLKNIEQLEEERRLFYVAASRAREQLYFTYPSLLNVWDSFFTKPSRFLIEVKNDKFKVWKRD